ncbi:MAG: hypothetical protein V8T17_01435 [Oscillospiraceae bacterium]
MLLLPLMTLRATCARRPASSSIVYATKNSTEATPLTLTNGEDAYPYAVGDYVLLNAFTNAVNSATESGLIKTGADKYGEIVSKATSVDGAQTIIYWNNEQHNVAGTWHCL